MTLTLLIDHSDLDWSLDYFKEQSPFKIDTFKVLIVSIGYGLENIYASLDSLVRMKEAEFPSDWEHINFVQNVLMWLLDRMIFICL